MGLSAIKTDIRKITYLFQRLSAPVDHADPGLALISKPHYEIGIYLLAEAGIVTKIAKRRLPRL